METGGSENCHRGLRAPEVIQGTAESLVSQVYKEGVMRRRVTARAHAEKDDRAGGSLLARLHCAPSRSLCHGRAAALACALAA